MKMEQLVEEEMGHAVEARVPLKVDISYRQTGAKRTDPGQPPR